MTLYKRLLLALALLTLIAPAANARFKKARISRNMSCKNNTAKATLDFEAGAPNGDYSAKLTAETESTDLTVEGSTISSDGVTKGFKIPKANTDGVVFDLAYDLAALQAMGTFEDMVIPITISPGDDLTSSTGFGSVTADLTITDEGCSGDDDTTESDSTDDLEEGLEGTDPPSFETIDINDLVSTDKDLVVNVTYKVSAVAYALAVGNLKEGEDITEKAKDLAAKFAIKLDIKGLKRLAFKELRAATKGLKGEAKKAAEAEARTKGLNKLLAEIKLKLPPLPAKDGENKEEIQKIRKAKKKKILEALTVELVEVTDSEDESQKCLSFKVTLPAKICANADGSKTLVIAGQAINILNLDPGETFTVDIPVKVVGTFQEFFGVETAARQKRGKKGPNGKTTIPLTLTNPVSEE